MATAYLTAEEFKLRSVMPPEEVDLLEQSYPGFLRARLAEVSGRIDARLSKRYLVPFASPPAEIVCAWVERLVTRDLYLRRGFTPGSKQDDEILLRAVAAETEIREAADAREGLFDLPVRDSEKKGEFWGYSEDNPYAWTDRGGRRNG